MDGRGREKMGRRIWEERREDIMQTGCIISKKKKIKKVKPTK